MKTLIPIAALVVALSFTATQCVSRKVEVKQEAAQLRLNADPFEDPSQHATQIVRIEGLFQGFRIADCRFSAGASTVGLTRSDWLVRREDVCLYVTGGTPAGIDPIDPRWIGRRVELRARVIRSGAGKFLLRFIEGRLLDE